MNVETKPRRLFLSIFLEHDQTRGTSALYDLNEKSLHPWVKVDQAGRPLPSKRLSILDGLTLKLVPHCIVICVIEMIWIFRCL